MSDVRTRLVRSFQTVFPDIDVSAIPGMAVANTAEWDSINSINLLQVIEEEFGVTIDFEELEHLDSFAALERRLGA